MTGPQGSEAHAHAHAPDDDRLRVLICRPDHLGDLLLTLAALPEHDPTGPRPRLHLGIACSPALVPIAARCPTIDTVEAIPFTDPAHPQPDGAPADGLAGHLREEWDIALLPRIDDAQSGRLCAAAGIPRRVGYDHPATAPWLTEVHTPVAGHVSHLTEHLLHATLLHGTAAPMPRSTPWITPTTTDLHDASAALAAHGLHADRLVLLHPGAGWPLKRWPPQHWAAVASQLIDAGCQVALTGVAAEAELHATILARLEPPAAAQVVSLAGAVGLPTLVGLYAQARLVVAIDSGPLHLAAAVGTPLVGIYGPFGPALFGPLGDATWQRVLTLQLPCQPCNTLELPPCGAPTLPPCLTDLAPAAVIAAAFDLLAAQQH